MTDKVKQLAPVIWSEIQKAKKILLHFHNGPDGDSIGSSLGLALALRNLGKDVTVIKGDSDLKLEYAFLPGFGSVISKNYFEIDISNHDLFLVLDSSSIDRISDLAKISFPTTLRTVVIDHHNSNTMFAAINLVDETYPATAQLIYDLLKIWGVPITADVAACLFTGIYTDTGGFQYEPSNWETFRIVGELAKVYPAFGRDISILENSNEPDKLFFRALAYDSIQILFGGRVALSAVSREQLSGKKIDSRYASISDISSGLRSVKGWDLDIAMLEKEGESCRVSLRTRDTTIFDLTKLAIALGGGGHKASSGATIRLPFVEAKKVLLETIQKVYPFLGRP